MFFQVKREIIRKTIFATAETFYDRSKALGELEDDKNITLRNSIVGPDINAEGIGLLNWFMQQSGEIKGYTKALWTGQTTLQLAKTMEVAAREKRMDYLIRFPIRLFLNIIFCDCLIGIYEMILFK